MSLLEARRRWQQATNTGASSSSIANASPLFSSQAGSQPIAQTDPNFFDCLICQQEHNIEEIYIAKPCGHEFCRSGAREFALSAIRSALHAFVYTLAQYTLQHLITFLLRGVPSMGIARQALRSTH